MPLDSQPYPTFLVVVLVAILLPGPDNLLIVRAALSGGNGHGFVALISVQIGLLGHLASAVLNFRFCRPAGGKTARRNRMSYSLPPVL